MLSYTYCKRNKYLNKYSFGRNNKGHITIRGKQGLFLKTTQLRNINYNYIFSKQLQNFINSNNLIKLQVIKKIFNIKLQKYIYIYLILNSVLKNQYEYFYT